jgi:hypothetical protein
VVRRSDAEDGDGDSERDGGGLSRRRLLQGATGLGAAVLAGCTMTAERGADRVVASSAALQAAFDTLSPGDTIYVSPENAPYRTTAWLDIDVDDVAVVGPGVPGLVEPVDRAGAGGIRIGHHRACENVLVRGFGFEGNREGQRDGAARLHGIAVRGADNVTLAGNDIRGTHPVRHGDGGSGISATRDCSNVRVVGNRVRDAGDRGIQVAGENVLVAGNDVVGCLDRAVSGDLWYPDGENYTVENCLVTGNLLGECAEGSLTGVAHNRPAEADYGTISIVGNLGFGHHKSFCHLRGPEQFRRVAVQHNTATHRTEELETKNQTRYAGVAVDAVGGRVLSIRDNSFHGYSGHGINVDGEVRNLALEGNTLTDAAVTGIRVRNAVGGMVTDNLVVGPGGAGIRVTDARDVRVGGNYVRRSGEAGIDVRGDGRLSGHELVDNYVLGAGGGGGRSGGPPGIRVCDYGVRVRGNTVRYHSGAAVAECEHAGDNQYETNRADSDDPWHIGSPDARMRDNAPPVDIHRGRRPDADGTLTVTFDRAYARPPRLALGRRGGTVESVSYRTDDEGNVVAADLSVDGDGPFDVFLDQT